MKDYEGLYYRFYDDLNVALIQLEILDDHFGYLEMHQHELILLYNLNTKKMNLKLNFNLNQPACLYRIAECNGVSPSRLIGFKFAPA
jgi:hypothetical protein